MKIGGPSVPNNNALEQFKANNDKALQQVASGLRINEAADDAAGLQLSNQLSSLISGQNTAIRNANDAISFAQVTEGALAQADQSLLRAEELAIQAANGSLSNEQRALIDQELSQITEQVSDIYTQTSFGGNPVFNSSVEFQIGASSFDVSDFSSGSVDVSGLSVASENSAQNSISSLQNFRSQISEQRAQIGAFQNGVSASINNLSNANESSEAARSNIRDADIASASANQVAEQIRLQGNLSLISQANISAPNILNLLK